MSPVPALWPRDRIGRLTALGPQDTAAGLLWLAMNFPAVCDAMLDKLEDDDIDDTDPSHEPGQIELHDPGHHPVVAWRLTPAPATRQTPHAAPTFC